MDKIVVIGGGGHAKVVISILKKIYKYKIYGYTDPVDKGDILSIPYLGKDTILQDLINKKDVRLAVIGIGQLGDSLIRQKKVHELKNMGYEFPKIISPQAILNEDVFIADGTVVMDNVTINTGVTIGGYCIINTGSIIEHDCVLGEHVHLAPGTIISGGVKIGKNVFVGAGSTIIHSIYVNDNCIIGAGALVTKDIKISGTYIGVPARKKI